MNLIQQFRQEDELDKDLNNDSITIRDFRQHQYDLIPMFFDLIIEYISKQNNNYLEKVRIDTTKKSSYSSLYNSDLFLIDVYIKTADCKEKLFFNIYLPELIKKTFFCLNGNTYIPAMYILDKPLTIKKKSIKLSSLFNPITIYKKDKIVIFTGINIPLSYFLQFFINDQDLLNEANKEYKLNTTPIDEKNLINYFSNVIQCNKDRQKIQEYFENLFFDDYTKKLYKKCYSFNDDQLNISYLIEYVLKLNLEGFNVEFVDLSFKRVIFIELLLTILFKKVGYLASRVAKGNVINELRIGQLDIIRYFTNAERGLKGNYLYNNVNLYSSILLYKASFIYPGLENPPSSISDLHPTHYGRICPVTISAQNPGQSIHIVPNAKLNEIGQFIGL